MREVFLKIMLEYGHGLVIRMRESTAEHFMREYERTKDFERVFSSRDFPWSAEPFEWTVKYGQIIAVHTANVPNQPVAVPTTILNAGQSGFRGN